MKNGLLYIRLESVQRLVGENSEQVSVQEPDRDIGLP